MVELLKYIWPFEILELVFGPDVTNFLGILNYIAHFILFPFMGAAILIYALFSQYWIFALGYLAWYVYDAKTPQQGLWCPVSIINTINVFFRHFL